MECLRDNKVSLQHSRDTSVAWGTPQQECKHTKLMPRSEILESRYLHLFLSANMCFASTGKTVNPQNSSLGNKDSAIWRVRVITVSGGRLFLFMFRLSMSKIVPSLGTREKTQLRSSLELLA